MRRRRHAKLSDAELARAATALKLQDASQVLAGIGQGDLTVTQVMTALYP
ncbi:MAG: RelA/SpoT AH/RIS domain-containing protein, partial [Gemmatimonadota bacterium]